MASLIRRRSGYSVQWTPADGGPRKTLPVGTVKRDAEEIRGHVSRIVSAQIRAQPVPDATARWLNEIGPALHNRMVLKGLTAERAGQRLEPIDLGRFLDAYIARRHDLKPASVANLKQVRKWMVKHFTEVFDVRRMTRADALDWQRFLRGKHSAAYADKLVKKAAQVFADAVDRELIRVSPFRKVKVGSMTNPDRAVQVPRETILAVVEKTPDVEWKLIFALARFAAARIPSEVRQLKWSDVLFDAGRMTLRSPKTERYEGRKSRVVPIAPELAALLTRALAEAAEGEVFALPRLRHLSNAATTADKLIERAGFTAWPRTFQNLRASCENDWADHFPEHVACAWSGNTTRTARKHYFRVTEDHFRAASGAADTRRQQVTEGDTTNKNRPEKPSGMQNGLAPEGPQLPRRNQSNPKKSNPALHGALHSVTRAGRLSGGKPNLRRSMGKIRALTRTARRAGGGR